MEPMDLPDMGTPQADQPFTTFSFSPLGLLGELAQDEQPDLAFDSVRPEMHAYHLESLAANRSIQLDRKRDMESSLLTAITAALSQCPCCSSDETCAQGPSVKVVWVGLAYRFELLVPICHCSLCQHTFSVRPLQVSCMPATAVHSWDLTKAACGSRPMCFDMDLLQVRETLTFLKHARIFAVI